MSWSSINGAVKTTIEEKMEKKFWLTAGGASSRGKMKLKKILIVNTDITAKKRLEAQFIKTQKMESIALLTGGIAHDLQNILAPVAMSIGLLREELKDQTSLTVLACG